jgi:hypothetical protein
MAVVNMEIRGCLQWELLYVDDLVLLGESKVDLKEKQQNWKVSMEPKGKKINFAMTK